MGTSLPYSITYFKNQALKKENPQSITFMSHTPAHASIFQSESEPEIAFEGNAMKSAFACVPFPSYQAGASERPGAVKGAPLLRGEANP